MKIKGCVNVGHTHTGNNGYFEYELSELNVTQEEWDNWSEDVRQEFLDGVLDTEIGNTLDVGIWVEED